MFSCHFIKVLKKQTARNFIKKKNVFNKEKLLRNSFELLTSETNFIKYS